MSAYVDECTSKGHLAVDSSNRVTVNYIILNILYTPLWCFNMIHFSIKHLLYYYVKHVFVNCMAHYLVKNTSQQRICVGLRHTFKSMQLYNIHIHTR